MKLSQQIKINFGSQFGGRILTLFLTTGTTFFLRRLFGRETYGDYIFILSLVNLLVSFSDFGTHLLGVKEASQKKKFQKEILGKVALLQFLLSFLALAGGIILLTLFFRWQKIYLLSLMSLPLVILMSLKRGLLTIFHSQLKLYFASLQDIVLSLFIFLMTVLFFIFKGSLTAYFLAMNFVYFLINLPFTWLAWQVGRPRISWDFVFFKKFLGQSFPLALVLVLYTVYSHIDTLILKYFWGSKEVGIYGLAYKIYENLVLPAAYLMNSFLPLLALKVKETNLQLAKELWQKIAALLVAGSFLISLIFFLFSPLIIWILTGSFQAPEVTALRLLLLALPLAFLNHLSGYTLIVLGEQTSALKISVLALIFNFIFNLIFIPIFSYYAAALFTALTEALVLWFSLKVIRKKINFFLLPLSWPKILVDFKKNGF